MSADDAENKRGFTLRIQVTDRKVSVTLDGKSVCINEVTQHLREKYESGQELTDNQCITANRETQNDYFSRCEYYIAKAIENACAEIIDNQVLAESLGKGCSLL